MHDAVVDILRNFRYSGCCRTSSCFSLINPLNLSFVAQGEASLTPKPRNRSLETPVPNFYPNWYVLSKLLPHRFQKSYFSNLLYCTIGQQNWLK